MKLGIAGISMTAWIMGCAGGPTMGTPAYCASSQQMHEVLMNCMAADDRTDASTKRICVEETYAECGVVVERPDYCRDEASISAALQDCTKRAADDATREGCFREAEVQCGASHE